MKDEGVVEPVDIGQGTRGQAEAPLARAGAAAARRPAHGAVL